MAVEGFFFLPPVAMEGLVLLRPLPCRVLPNRLGDECLRFADFDLRLFNGLGVAVSMADWEGSDCSEVSLGRGWSNGGIFSKGLNSSCVEGSAVVEDLGSSRTGKGGTSVLAVFWVSTTDGRRTFSSSAGGTIV